MSGEVKEDNEFISFEELIEGIKKLEKEEKEDEIDNEYR